MAVAAGTVAVVVPEVVADGIGVGEVFVFVVTVRVVVPEVARTDILVFCR